MSDETDLSHLEERVKKLEEKMEYVWAGLLIFIRSVAEKLDNQSSEQSPISSRDA